VDSSSINPASLSCRGRFGDSDDDDGCKDGFLWCNFDSEMYLIKELGILILALLSLVFNIIGDSTVQCETMGSTLVGEFFRRLLVLSTSANVSRVPTATAPPCSPMVKALLSLADSVFIVGEGAVVGQTMRCEIVFVYRR